MEIRSETVADYASIASLHARAFGPRSAEANIVALLRQRSVFDPGLSLVAELEGRIIGHVLFSPHRMRLLGQTVPAVSLAPIAVDPSHQGQGIGGRLITAGHTLAAAKGYAISFLLGHPTYYPRFGYRQHAYGSAQVAVTVEDSGGEPLERRPPTAEDVPALQALWHQDEAAVDFALDPGPDLLDWLSPDPAVRETVYLREGEIVGYTRIHTGDPAKPRVFLARDGAMARAVAHLIARETHASELNLPIHPAAASAAGFPPPRCQTMAAAMAISLAPSPLDDYLAQVQEEHRWPGRPTWPVAFDLASSNG